MNESWVIWLLIGLFIAIVIGIFIWIAFYNDNSKSRSPKTIMEINDSGDY